MSNDDLNALELPGSIKLVYRSPNYEVSLLDFGSRENVFVSFAMRNPKQTMPFGEQFFIKYRLNVILVTPRASHWYQHSDSPEAASAIKEAASCFNRVIAYGTSMGAYAAIAFANLIRPDIVLAFSPQYSIDPMKVPFEDRWLEDGKNVMKAEGFVFDDVVVPEAGRTIIFYDPLDLDSKHVALYREKGRIEEVLLPLSSHRSLTVMSEMRILSQMLIGAAAGVIDLAALRRQVRNNRNKSSTYLRHIARASHQRNLGSSKSFLDQARYLTKHRDFDAIESNLRLALSMALPKIATAEFCRLLQSENYASTSLVFSDFKRLLSLEGVTDYLPVLRATLDRIGDDDVVKLQSVKLMLTFIDAAEGRREEAIIGLTYVAAIGGFPRLIAEASTLYDLLGMVNEAIEIARLALRTQPDNHDLLTSVVNRLHKHGRLAAATALLKDADHRSALPVVPHLYRLAALLWEQGQFDEAATVCDRVLDKRPDYANAYRLKARLLFESGYIELACVMFNSALERAPNDVAAMEGLAKSLAKLHRYPEAVSVAHKVMKFDRTKHRLLEAMEKLASAAAA